MMNFCGLKAYLTHHYGVCAVILNNRRVTIAEVANHVHFSRGSMHEIIRTDQAFIKTVQDGFQAGHRRAQVQCFDICQHPLNCCENEGYDFLRRIITVDKTWIHYHSPEIKHQSME